MKKDYVCAIFIRDDQVFCCQSRTEEGAWAFPYSDVPHQVLGDTLLASLSHAVTADYVLDVHLGRHTDGVKNLDAQVCRLNSGEPQLVEPRPCQWLSAQALDSVEWEPLCAPFIFRIKELLRQKDCRVALDNGDGTEETVYAGCCSKVESLRRFQDAILQQKAQKDAATQPYRWRQVRLYNHYGELIATES